MDSSVKQAVGIVLDVNVRIISQFFHAEALEALTLLGLNGADAARGQRGTVLFNLNSEKD